MTISTLLIKNWVFTSWFEGWLRDLIYWQSIDFWNAKCKKQKCMNLYGIVTDKSKVRQELTKRKEIGLIDWDILPRSQEKLLWSFNVVLHKAYDEVINCSHGSHRNVLAGEHCHMRSHLLVEIIFPQCKKSYQKDNLKITF